VQGQVFGLAGHVPTLARVQPMTPLRVTVTVEVRLGDITWNYQNQELN
jgi:hypothetical protein